MTMIIISKGIYYQSDNEKGHRYTLWHKVDIRDFHCHKNVNVDFCNNFVGLTVADDLKSR